MIRILAESGFCHGVKTAVLRARSLIGGGERVYLYGDLTNNRHVMAGFLRDGFVVAEKVKDIPDGATVVIRAHGVGRDVYDALSAKNVEIIDCTCVKVKKIHKIVEGKMKVAIIGKKNHPEVLGISGWCDGFPVENIDDINRVIENAPLYVVAQTTCKIEWWEKAVKMIKDKCPNAEIFNTLCDITTKRIENAVQMAKESDAMVVVGDKKSANSVELYEACKAACSIVIFVSSVEELSECASTLLGVESISIAGSASSPIETVTEIYEYLLFAKFLSNIKSETEKAGDDYFNKLSGAQSNDQFVSAAISDLYAQNKGGKRIRGAMVHLGYTIAGGVDASAIAPIALAYELFQTSILIHDDVIDKSMTRRGKPTIHASAEDAHFGISRAVCIGDYGLFLVNRMIAESGLSSEILVRVMRLFSDIQLKTLEGEIMDVCLPYFPDIDDHELTVLRIYEYKTAWYTLVGPAMMGAVCAGVELDDEFLGLLHGLLLPLGVAFQIKDDLLGIFGSEEELGKPALSDIAENKQTILYGFAKKYNCNDTQNALKKSYGNPHATHEDLAVVRDIFIKTGAKQFAEEEAARLSALSMKAIDKIQEESRPILRGLVNFLLTRRT
ncbi:MAG: polyprenyl synthetase family protein [Defluviitaleaceae bacterium]|nr:polyprenyl synthetase family protein [Defluviitaleaceae bacterium]